VHQSPESERVAANHRYSELNAAYNCLRDPKDRLRHLLELELGGKPADIQRVPPEMMDGHFAVAGLCREADNLIAESARISSPILKVQQFERNQELTEKLRARQQIINVRHEKLMKELESMNPAWLSRSANDAAQPELPLENLDAIYRELGYLTRWSAQLQERVVQLSF
jgi:hypothetical protein